MKKFIIYPYKMASRAARELRLSLEAERGVRAIRVRPGATPRPGRSTYIVNWGCASLPEWSLPGATWLNEPGAVDRASNKLASLRCMHEAGVPVVDFTSNMQEAAEWKDEGAVVVVRTKLRGSGGAGIVLCTGNDENLAPARLYTRYWKKKCEYRVHVFRGEVLHIQQKKARQERLENEDVDYQVRNVENGWVFAIQGVDLPDRAKQIARDAVRAHGLDFGAVDIGWNKYYNEYRVFEVNTACGLEGTTLARYVNKLLSLG